MNPTQEQLEKMEEDFPECSECDGSGTIWSGECPICDGLGYTISAKNSIDSNENF